MYYKKIASGKTIIEFHNNWLGQETVIVNGQTVSKKYSILGTSHYFSVLEEGHQARYVLTTRVHSDGISVVIDLSRNGEVLHVSLPIKFGFGAPKTKNKPKRAGILQLQEYHLEDALRHFDEALNIDFKDPEIYFYQACAYSIMERPEDGFEALKKAVEYRLPDQEAIFNHDMLAFLRMHPAFEHFVNSGFTEYELDLPDAPTAE